MLYMFHIKGLHGRLTSELRPVFDTFSHKGSVYVWNLELKAVKTRESK